jgi:hypothetical protein
VKKEKTMTKKLEKTWSADNVETVAVFWHNEGPGGFGLYFGRDKNETGLTAQDAVDVMENTYQEFLKEMEDDLVDCEKWLSGEIFEQIQAASEVFQGGERNTVEWAHGILGKKEWRREEFAEFLMFGPTNVYILERLGRLDPVDEWNGCVILYAMDASAAGA